MRFSARLLFLAAAFGLCAGSALAAPSALDQWFSSAASVDKPGPIQHIKTADYMCGKTFETMCKDRGGTGVLMLSFWELLKYDRTHHVGLARSGTDQVGFSLFKAASLPPGATVPDADLSQYGTGGGLHLGSPYSQVLALYGPPVKHGQHFVTSYSAEDIVTYKGKPQYFHGTLERQFETITIVVDGGRVSAITINVEIWEP